MKIDLHIHTCFSSDSNLALIDIIRAVATGKIDGVAITDHNEISGALELKKIAPFPVIIGEEILTRDGEITGLFLKEKIEPGLSLSETIEIIKKQGGLVAVPHPYDRLRSSAIGGAKLEMIVGQIDLIEIFNSRNVFIKDNHHAAAFADRHNIARIVGSDAHTTSEIAASYIEIDFFADANEFMVNLSNAKYFTGKSPFQVHLATKTRKFLNRLKVQSKA